jgi:hypothetical protein
LYCILLFFHVILRYKGHKYTFQIAKVILGTVIKTGVSNLMARHVSGITFIRYAQSQKIQKPNNMKVIWEQEN